MTTPCACSQNGTIVRRSEARSSETESGSACAGAAAHLICCSEATRAALDAHPVKHGIGCPVVRVRYIYKLQPAAGGQVSRRASLVQARPTHVLAIEDQAVAADDARGADDGSVRAGMAAPINNASRPTKQSAREHVSGVIGLAQTASSVFDRGIFISLKPSPAPSSPRAPVCRLHDGAAAQCCGPAPAYPAFAADALPDAGSGNEARAAGTRHADVQPLSPPARCSIERDAVCAARRAPLCKWLFAHRARTEQGPCGAADACSWASSARHRRR